MFEELFPEYEEKFTEEMKAEMSNGLEEGENPNALKSKLRSALSSLSTAITQKYSNSSLVDKTLLSPNCSKPRANNIDRLTPHHTAGVLSVSSALEWFSKTSTQASCNYIVGYDGTIGLCVEEKNRPWTSSSRLNDNRAITFEVCNCGWKADGWPISAKSFEALVALCTDICKRYSKTKLLYINNKDQALAYSPKSNEMILTKHEWFNNTECPGPSLGAKFPELARRVTANLNNKEDIDLGMTKDELKKFIKDTIKDVDYQDVKNVPSWWRDTIQTLLDTDTINGGTDKNVNATDVNLTYTEAKMCAIMVRYVDSKFKELEEKLSK